MPVCSIQTVLSTNPSIVVHTVSVHGRHYQLSGFIDMDVSSGYGDIIKMKNKQFFIDIKTNQEIDDYLFHEAKDFQSLLKVLNLQII